MRYVLRMWQPEKNCDCPSHPWVQEYYQKRKALGKQNKGYLLKLGLNALYGKKAQGTGSRPYCDVIHAGLITSITRERLLDAVAQDPSAIVMLKTDRVYSLEKLPLEPREDLGQWEFKEHCDIFIIQPGAYHFPKDEKAQLKTRGVLKRRMKLRSENLVLRLGRRSANVEDGKSIFQSREKSRMFR
jgi:hypothetical protein